MLVHLEEDLVDELKNAKRNFGQVIDIKSEAYQKYLDQI